MRISVINVKGGVGKTTTAVSLSPLLSGIVPVLPCGLSCLPQSQSLRHCAVGQEEVVTVAWSGQPADTRDELELVDVYDPELDLFDDLDEWVAD